MNRDYDSELAYLLQRRKQPSYPLRRNEIIDRFCAGCGRRFPTDQPRKMWCSMQCYKRIQAKADRQVAALATQSQAPTGFDLITTYAELTEYSKAFAAGSIGFLLLVGSPGSGKSRQFQADLNSGEAKYTWIDNHATNLALYCSVYEAHNQPVVLDDVNHFLRNKQACSLVKALTQTEEKRNVSWESPIKYLDDREVPRKYSTSSPICLIGNTWKSTDADYAAIQDRSLPVAFYPSAETIHKRVLELGWCDPDIVAFVEKHLSIIPQPSMREYYIAGRYKQFLKHGWQDKMRAIWSGKAEQTPT